jgi:hypothetical protein
MRSRLAVTSSPALAKGKVVVTADGQVIRFR